MNFSDWLLTRYQYDAYAKNSYVQHALLEYLRNHTKVRVVDLGAGMGANFYYYRDLFPTLQQWWLLDNDENLLEKCKTNIWEKSYEEGYKVKKNKQELIISGKEKEFTVTTVCASLTELEHVINIEEVDLVMANAVFDLFTSDQFKVIAKLCASNRVPFLATLNYQGMRFNPPSQNDDTMIKLYEEHMQRTQDDGKAMGPKCCIKMKEILMNTGMEAINGSSRWHIPAEDHKMLDYYLEFMGEALKTMDIDYASLEDWLNGKKQMIRDKQVALEVDHEDIVAFPM